MENHHFELASETKKALVVVELRQEGRVCVGLVSTGQKNTVLSKKIIEDLELIKDEDSFYHLKIRVNGTDGSAKSLNIKATSLPYDFSCGDMLIGMDVLQHARFEYNGMNKTFSLTF